MKNILSIILLIIMVCQCKSQTLNTNANANNINNDINKFIGTWSWSNGNESLQLVLKKENILLPIQGNVRADILFGFHKFVKNNVIIENSTQNLNSSYNDSSSTLLGYTLENPNKLLGSIIHTTKNKSIQFYIDYIDATHIKLVELKDYPGLRVNIPGKPTFDWSISLPQNIILTKQ